jgi:hypothetical protein
MSDKLTINMIKWSKPEFRREYNKEYYKLNKGRQDKTRCIKVACTLCNRQVLGARLAKHMLTKLCFNNRISK